MEVSQSIKACELEQSCGEGGRRVGKAPCAPHHEIPLQLCSYICTTRSRYQQYILESHFANEKYIWMRQSVINEITQVLFLFF